MIKRFFSFLVLMVVIWSGSGCENPNDVSINENRQSPELHHGGFASKILPSNGTTTTTSVDFWAGQTIDIGSVSITNDAQNLYVTFTTVGDWYMKESHLDIATTPFTERGAPGLYLYQTSHQAGTQTFTYTVPLTWTSGTTIYLLPHAAVEKIVNGEVVQGETAMGGTYVNPRRGSWYATFSYVIQHIEEQKYSLSGYTYFDANGNGQKDATEPAVPNVAVILDNGASTVSDANGYYSLGELRNNTYTVTAAAVTGLVGPNPSSSPVVISYANVENVNFGYLLDMIWIGNQSANGFTIGYWKTNIDKAIKGTTKGVQVSKATLESYVSSLSTFALTPLNVTSLQNASNILSASSSVPTSLLSKQLMGSEFNYQNGAYIGNNQLVTYLFVYYGEYILANSVNYSSEQILQAKDMYDAYNNSHGGLIILQ